MKKSEKIVLVTHIPGEDGGRFADMIKARKIPLEFVRVYNGDPFPSPREYRGVIVMGGMESANSDSELMQRELKFVREALDAQIPYLGICFGLQALVKAAGGKIVESQRAEIGFRVSHHDNTNMFSLKRTSKSQNDPLFTGINDTIDPVFLLHGHTVDIVDSIYPVEVLATDHDNTVPHQIIKVGPNAYGIQGHFELNTELLEIWLNVWDYTPVSAMEKDILREDFTRLGEGYHAQGQKLFNNFLDILS